MQITILLVFSIYRSTIECIVIKLNATQAQELFVFESSMYVFLSLYDNLDSIYIEKYRKK